MKIDVNQKVLTKNEQVALRVRSRLAETKTLALNFVSSPGSGKTTILEKILAPLNAKYRLAVVEGDLQTDNDKCRIEAVGVKAVQINTGNACHLEAIEIERMLDNHLGDELELLIIENVGNMVCPSEYDLGEDAKIAVLSVTEGDDKPAKYPTMFHNSDAFIINKIDLLPYVDFSVDAAIRYAKGVNPDLKVFQVSARTGEGLQDVVGWIEERIAQKKG